MSKKVVADPYAKIRPQVQSCLNRAHSLVNELQSRGELAAAEIIGGQIQMIQFLSGCIGIFKDPNAKNG